MQSEGRCLILNRKLFRWCAGGVTAQNPTGVAGGGSGVQTATTIALPRAYTSQSISKGCVPICPRGGVDIGLVAASINCCSSSLCNVSGASSIKSNYLILAVGILASFFHLFGGRLG
ncbi:UNVERIFIED_CONTAM: hypothetical protein K2H54_006592 [Gekko kuhli]